MLLHEKTDTFCFKSTNLRSQSCFSRFMHILLNVAGSDLYSILQIASLANLMSRGIEKYFKVELPLVFLPFFINNKMISVVFW